MSSGSTQTLSAALRIRLVVVYTSDSVTNFCLKKEIFLKIELELSKLSKFVRKLLFIEITSHMQAAQS